MSKILQVFFDVDLRNLAKDKKIKVADLKDGEFLVFLNSKKDKVKVYGSHDVYAYYRSPSGRIALEMISHIPNSFSGNSINFDKAIKSALLEMGVKE